MIGDRALSFPKHKKNGGSENKKLKQNPCTGTRYTRYFASLEPRDVSNSSANLFEVEQSYDELEKRLTGEHEAAAHEES